MSPSPEPETPVTKALCLSILKKFINEEKKSLNKFYKADDLENMSDNAVKMVEGLMKDGCGKETALQLMLLTLYDIAMLLDDSTSMEIEEDGRRRETLKNTMEAITGVYDLANSEGLLSVQFFNSKKGYDMIPGKRPGVKKAHVPMIWKRVVYNGVTRIGSTLRDKILEKFVWKDGAMKKPLLVMIITDGAVEGEKQDLLKNTIADCVKRVKENDKLGEDSIAFHFSQVGNDKKAKEFLRKIDNHSLFGKHVDCLDVNISLDDLDKDKWFILPKLLLGAILESYDDRDMAVDDKIVDNVDDEEYDSLEDTDAWGDLDKDP